MLVRRPSLCIYTYRYFIFICIAYSFKSYKSWPSQSFALYSLTFCCQLPSVSSTFLLLIVNFTWLARLWRRADGPACSNTSRLGKFSESNTTLFQSQRQFHNDAPSVSCVPKAWLDKMLLLPHFQFFVLRILQQTNGQREARSEQLTVKIIDTGFKKPPHLPLLPSNYTLSHLFLSSHVSPLLLTCLVATALTWARFFTLSFQSKLAGPTGEPQMREILDGLAATT